MADEKKKVDKTSEKEAAKAKKKAAEAAIKEKRKELKKNPDKKEKQGNPFQRAGKAIAKFLKEFRGTIKKIIWPDRKSVIKNTLVVFAVMIVVGIGVWVVDYALSEGIQLIGRAAEAIQQEDETEGESTTAAQTQAATTTAAAQTETEEDTTA
jgi:preprotein translocase subunit SecE